LRPTQADLIDCVVASLDTYITPELQGSMARSQMLTVRYLLEQLRRRVVHETEALAESAADMRETLDRVRGLLADGPDPPPGLARIAGDVSARLAAAAPPEGPALGPLGWEPPTAQLREAVDDVLRALEAAEAGDGPAGVVAQARTALHECIARQLEREARWLVMDYTAPRR
jgi:hypothetical protein